MILFVRVETLAYYNTSNGDFHLKRRFEEISGEPCMVLHVSQATPKAVGELKPKAILLSGCGTWFRDFDVKDFYPFEDLLTAHPEVPTLGFCGSHQLIGFVFNEGFRNMDRVIDEPMRPLRPGEPDHANPPRCAVGMFREEGIYPIQVVKPDPLFEGLPDPFLVRESHYCEIKRLPPQFDLLATSENCRVQAMRHRERPLYGTQFHPEAYVEAYPHGRRVLENFFKIAGVL
jgi:GMP synthase-like glutamine amidotransferase